MASPSANSKEFISEDEEWNGEKIPIQEVREVSSLEVERRLKRKLDFRIVPAACIIYLLCFLDRSNIVSLTVSLLVTFAKLMQMTREMLKY